MTLTIRILKDKSYQQLELDVNELLIKIPTANFRDIKYCIMQETSESYAVYSAMVIFEI